MHALTRHKKAIVLWLIFFALAALFIWTDSRLQFLIGAIMFAVLWNAVIQSFRATSADARKEV